MVLGLWTALGGYGAPGIELAYNVRNPDEVGQVLQEADRAGGTIVRPPAVADWGGTTGAFADRADLTNDHTRDGSDWQSVQGAPVKGAVDQKTCRVWPMDSPLLKVKTFFGATEKTSTPTCPSGATKHPSSTPNFQPPSHFVAHAEASR